MPPSDEKNINRLFIKISAVICATKVLLAVVACIILKRGMSFTDLTIGKVHISHSTLVWNKKLQLENDAIAHTLPFAKLRKLSRVDLEMKKYRGNDFSRTMRERFNQAE